MAGDPNHAYGMEDMPGYPHPPRLFIFYFTDESVYHVVGTEHDYNQEKALCGLEYMTLVQELNEPYYEAKAGVDFTGDGACAYGRTMCEECRAKLEDIK